jgi:hypothetical protein
VKARWTWGKHIIMRDSALLYLRAKPVVERR